MNNLVITISRAYGSGGSLIGRKIAQILGIAYYDRTLIDKIAHKKGLDHKYIADWQEYSSDLDVWNVTNHLARFFSLGLGIPFSLYYKNYQRMFSIQTQIILELAENTPCVIVGRCADYILKNRSRCLNVWIGADEASRTRRLYDEYMIRSGSLVDKLHMVDRGRADYYKRCTGLNWGEHYNYHIHLDSGIIQPDMCAQIICSAAQNLCSLIKS